MILGENVSLEMRKTIRSTKRRKKTTTLVMIPVDSMLPDLQTNDYCLQQDNSTLSSWLIKEQAALVEWKTMMHSDEGHRERR